MSGATGQGVDGVSYVGEVDIGRGKSVLELGVGNQVARNLREFGQSKCRRGIQ